MKTPTLLCTLLLWTATAFALDEAQINQRIQILERAGHFAAAVPYYEEWQRLAPDKAPVVRGHARALAAIGEHQRIVDLLDAWLERHPQDGPAALLLGDAHRELDDLDQAVTSWRRAIDKNNAASYGQVADRCRAAGLRQEAIRILREAQQIQPGLYSWELASLYLEENDYRPAIEMFIASLRQAPQRLPVVSNRLETACRADGAAVLQTLKTLPADEPLLLAHLTTSCALAAGDFESGLAALATLEDQGAEQLFQYAARAEALGHAPVAARAYGLFATRLPDSPYRYQALSRQAALTALRDSDAALDLYRRMARDFPNHPETLQTLVGMARLQLEKRGDVQGAVASLQTVVDSPRRGPWTPQALALIAECSLRLGDLDQSERFLSALEKHHDSAYQARYHRAELYYFRGDFASADSILTELSATDLAHPLANDAFDLLLIMEDYAGSNGLATLSRAQLLERQGQTHTAKKQWAWLEKHAEPALAERSLLINAQLLQREGQYSQAKALYERQLIRYPKGPHVVAAQLGLAALYERRGDIAQALKTFETALLQHPDNPRAPEIRLRIQRLRQLRESG